MTLDQRGSCSLLKVNCICRGYLETQKDTRASARLTPVDPQQEVTGSDCKYTLTFLTNMLNRSRLRKNAEKAFGFLHVGVSVHLSSPKVPSALLPPSALIRNDPLLDQKEDAIVLPYLSIFYTRAFFLLHRPILYVKF